METTPRHKGTPLLDSLPRTDPFVVEAGFFDRFPQQVQGALPKERMAGILPAWLRPALAMTLVIGVLVVAVMRPWSPSPQQASTNLSLPPGELLLDEFADELYMEADMHVAWPDLSEDELAAWLERDPHQLDELIHLN